MASHLLIVNPVAGSGEGRARANVLVEALSTEHEARAVETHERGSATELAAENAMDYDRIIAVGGDGTLNEVLAGLMERRSGAGETAALGFLPAGTANGACRAFDLATEPEVAAASLADPRTMLVDVGTVRHEDGERHYLIRFGAGLDAAVLEELNASRSGFMGFLGVFRNVPRIIAVMRAYDDPDIAVEVDGEFFGRGASVVLSNVADVGLAATVDEEADPSDGLLEVLTVPMPSKWDIIRYGLRMVASSLASAPEVRKTRGRLVRLTSDGDVPCQADGEPVGRLPVEVELTPSAVRLLLT
ncbi:MAG: hypothetical protein HKN72_17630 [Gemmatimonadetes bacterium]|nr:hypothetical protein [Gemmatimonadota bacterium]NNF15051.1 hypothetical protein [Gemmatimonadota bacterium]